MLLQSMGIFTALLFVLGLIGVAMWVARRFGGAKVNPRSRIAVEIVQRVPFGPKAGLAVVRVGEKVMAVSISAEGIRPLFELDEADRQHIIATSQVATPFPGTVDASRAFAKLLPESLVQVLARRTVQSASTAAASASNVTATVTSAAVAAATATAHAVHAEIPSFIAERSPFAPRPVTAGDREFQSVLNIAMSGATRLVLLAGVVGLSIASASTRVTAQAAPPVVPPVVQPTTAPATQPAAQPASATQSPATSPNTSAGTALPLSNTNTGTALPLPNTNTGTAQPLPNAGTGASEQPAGTVNSAAPGANVPQRPVAPTIVPPAAPSTAGTPAFVVPKGASRTARPAQVRPAGAGAANQAPQKNISADSTKKLAAKSTPAVQVAAAQRAGNRTNAAPAATIAGSDDALAKMIPQMDLKMGDGKDGGLRLSGTVGIVVMMGLLTLIPTLLLMMTGFTRILIVLHFLKQAMGTQSAPPAQLLAAMALLLTGFVMAPTLTEVNKTALQPWMDGKMTQVEMLKTGVKPLRVFMLKQTREPDLKTFIELSRLPRPNTVDDVPLHVVMSAFVASELRRSFQIGFMIYLPFIVIDAVVASVLMSMGMFMLPPAMISMPFKLLLFVLVDGWGLLIHTLVQSFK